MAKQEIQGFCPSCGTSLYYVDGETVTCPACDKQVTPRSNWEAERVAESASASAAIIGLDNPESALVYLENYYENYDWEKYAETTVIVPATIEKIVENNKLKNGAAANSWLLSFQSLAFPLFKKIEGLGKLERTMAEKYNPKNNDEVLKLFDTYRRIVKILVEKKAELVKRLESDIKYAERFGIDENTKAQMKGQIDNISKSLAGLKTVEKLSELPVYTAAKAQADKKKAAEFFERGIDAASVYKDAVAKFESDGASKIEAAALFESIRGYADSADYVARINKYFNFNYEFFDYMGRKFIFKEEKYTLDVAGKKGGCFLTAKKRKAENAQAQAMEEANAKICLSLYAIDEDGLPEEKPLIKGINSIIKCYAGRVYFYKNREGIVCYDFASGQTEVLDKGNDQDYLNGKGEYDCFVNADGNGFCFKKRLPLKNSKAGCLKKAKTLDRENNYQLIFVDMKTNIVKPYVEELVDIDSVYGDYVFFNYATLIQPEKKKGCFAKIKKIFGKADPDERKIETSLHYCDLVSGECKKIFDEGSIVLDVIDGKVVYLVGAPNIYNVDIYTYDIATADITLIEKNARDYYVARDGYIYYTIGNENHEPLVRNNLVGTERVEVMRNVSKIVGERGGWIYVKKGYGTNAVLVKVSNDGKERVFVAPQFKELVCVNETLVYYIDTFDSLCSVRTDGNELKLVATDIESIIAISDDAIIYSASEKVSKKEYAESIYSVDIDGRNTIKIVFNVDKVVNYDENKLYFSKSDRVRYKVTAPISKKKTDTHYAYFNTTEYYEYDKKTKTSTLVLTLGLPNASTELKSGCFLFKKKIEGHIIFEKDPEKVYLVRVGLEKPGSINDVQVEEAKAADSATALAKAQMQKFGCNGKPKGKKGGKNNGCAVVKGVGCVFAVLAAIPIIGILFKPFAPKKGKKR